MIHTRRHGFMVPLFILTSVNYACYMLHVEHIVQSANNPSIPAPSQLITCVLCSWSGLLKRKVDGGGGTWHLRFLKLCQVKGKWWIKWSLVFTSTFICNVRALFLVLSFLVAISFASSAGGNIGKAWFLSCGSQPSIFYCVTTLIYNPSSVFFSLYIFI